MKFKLLEELGPVPCIYATEVLADGWGDVGHLLDRVKALKDFPEDFVKQSAVSVRVVQEDGVDRDAIMKAKLMGLSEDHPIRKCNAVFLNGRRLDLLSGILEDEFTVVDYAKSFEQGVLIHQVSTLCEMSHMPEGSLSPYMYTQMGEFDRHNFERAENVFNRRKLSPLNNHLGLLKSGVFLKQVKQYSEEDKVQLLNEGRDSELLQQIFGKKDSWDKGDVEAFDQNTTVVLAYVQSQSFLDKIMKQLESIPAKDNITIVLTGHGKIQLADKYPERITVINKMGHDQYIPGSDYKVLQAFATKDIAICSGDKSFEEALSSGAIPLFQVKSIKAAEYRALLSIVAKVAGDSPEGKRLLEFLNAYSVDKECPVEALTEEMCQYWRENIWPVIMREHNVFDRIPEIEYKAQLTHHLVHNKSLTSEQMVEIALEFSDEDLVGVMQEMVDINPLRLKSILQTIPERKEKCLDILLAQNTSSPTRSNTGIVYLVLMTCEKDELERTYDGMMDSVRMTSLQDFGFRAKKQSKINKDILYSLISKDYDFLSTVMQDKDKMEIFKNLGGIALRAIASDVLREGIDQVPETSLHALIVALSYAGFHNDGYAHLELLNILEAYVSQHDSIPEWMQQVIIDENQCIQRDEMRGSLSPIAEEMEIMDRLEKLEEEMPPVEASHDDNAEAAPARDETVAEMPENALENAEEDFVMVNSKGIPNLPKSDSVMKRTFKGLMGLFGSKLEPQSSRPVDAESIQRGDSMANGVEPESTPNKDLDDSMKFGKK